MKRFWPFLILAVICGGVFWLVFFNQQTEQTSQTAFMLENLKKEKSVRQPAVAGQFYPSDKAELTKMISQFLEEAVLPADLAQGKIRALIVPHAGYVFSGQVAAYGFKTVQGQPIKRVILVGSSHQQYLTGAVIDSNDAWQTPLGQVNLDIDLRDTLVKESPLFSIDSAPHQTEHSLEVEVPFLQAVLSGFKILPILVSQLSDNDLEKISQALTGHLDNQTLIVVSSDMSHYPVYNQANYADKKVIQAILFGQVSNLRQIIAQLEAENIPNLSTCLCGQTAVEVLMKIAEKIENRQIKLLKYANSGDTEFGDKTQVVGYSAISFAGDVILSEAKNLMRNSDDILNKTQKKTLLEIAKTSVEKYVLENKVPQFENNDSLLNEPRGAFVTLKKQGQLRGCIGRFEPNTTLYQVVSQMAMAAATQDSRFEPVQADELNDLEYEISVLSPLEKINDWHKIEIGKHGVQIRQGSRSGVFLPQVAAENNWDLEEFMDNLCENKANLPADTWKTDQVELYIFTAEVFGE